MINYVGVADGLVEARCTYGDPNSLTATRRKYRSALDRMCRRMHPDDAGLVGGLLVMQAESNPGTVRAFASAEVALDLARRYGFDETPVHVARAKNLLALYEKAGDPELKRARPIQGGRHSDPGSRPDSFVDPHRIIDSFLDVARETRAGLRRSREALREAV